MSQSTILNAILNGEHDDILDEIVGAVKQRRKASRVQRDINAMADIGIGDTIRISGISPKYLNGERAEVTGKNNTRLEIKLERTVRRYAAGYPLTVPAGCCEKVA